MLIKWVKLVTFTYELDNFDEMKTKPEKQKLSKLQKDEIQNLNNLISVKNQ
jgi:hypothetical protein